MLCLLLQGPYILASIPRIPCILMSSMFPFMWNKMALSLEFHTKKRCFHIMVNAQNFYFFQNYVNFCKKSESYRKSNHVFVFFLMEQWPIGQGAGFPIQGFHVQNHWVAPRLTQPFILLRSVKWVPEISGNLVVKSKLPPRSGSSLEAVEPHP